MVTGMHFDTQHQLLDSLDRAVKSVRDVTQGRSIGSQAKLLPRVTSPSHVSAATAGASRHNYNSHNKCPKSSFCIYN